jgi:excisionase family DNA binding protein
MSTTPDLVTVATAAQELRLTPQAIRNAIMRGAITAVRLDGRTNLVSRAEVERYRREHLGQRGKRPQPEGLTEQQRRRRAYQQAYYQRRKAARQQQPAAEPAE